MTGYRSSEQQGFFIRYIVAAFLFPMLTALCQIAPIDRSKATILSEPVGAEVWVGDSLYGTTPLLVDTAIVTNLQIIYPNKALTDHLVRRIARPFVDSQTGVIVVRFERNVMIQSVPIGSAILVGDSIIGYTPQSVQLIPPKEVHVTHPGYETLRITVTDTTNDTLLVVLDYRRTDSVSGNTNTIASRFPAILTASALTALSAGAVVHFIQKSNELFKDYSVSGQQQQRQDAQKNRILAMLAMVILEASFVCLTYFLFKE